MIDVQYFIEQQGVPGEGVDVKSLGEKHVSEQEISKMFGPRFDKNG